MGYLEQIFMQKKMSAETALSAVNRNQGKLCICNQSKNTIKEMVMRGN
jgi:hypothetical protein